MMYTTLFVVQEEMSWLKAVASQNLSCICVAFDTSQALISSLDLSWQ